MRFIAQVKKAYPGQLLCRLLGVSRSGFYDYLRRQERDPDPEHEEKLEPDYPEGSATLRSRSGIGGVRVATYPRRGIIAASLKRRLNRSQNSAR